MIRTYYNYVGKEYFPCWLSTVIYYLVIPYMVSQRAAGARDREDVFVQRRTNKHPSFSLAPICSL